MNSQWKYTGKNFYWLSRNLKDWDTPLCVVSGDIFSLIVFWLGMGIIEDIEVIHPFYELFKAHFKILYPKRAPSVPYVYFV